MDVRFRNRDTRSSHSFGVIARPITGFTLVELVVSIAVVTLLLAILLPAVQSSREAARRLHCSSNLKQLTMGVHSYESSFGCLPMFGQRLDADGSYNGFIKSLLFQVGIGRDFATPRRINLLFCPADVLTDSERSPLSYVINAGPNLQKELGDLNGIVATRRYVADAQCVRLSDVTDGASQTSCFSERLGSFGVIAGTEPTPAKRYFWNITVVSSPTNVAQWVDEATSACESGPRTLLPFGGNGQTLDWWQSDGLLNSLYSHLMRPNTPNCTTQPIAFLLPVWGGGYATSEHRGGVNVSHLDGSVRFVSEMIDHRPWRAAGSRDGGEVVK